MFIDSIKIKSYLLDERMLFVTEIGEIRKL